MPLTATPLRVPEVVLVESTVMADERGAFTEVFKSSEFAALGLPTSFVQDNRSSSAPGVLRGIHFQRDPHAQGKLVSVAAGAVFDVAVDLRSGSPTFGQWAAVELVAGDGKSLWIPEGFGHGFVVRGDSVAVLSYKCTNEYSRPHDAGIRWDDPDIGIDWGLDRSPVLSAKDLALPALSDSPELFTFGH